jgi:general secretion pathway protein B
VSTILKALEKLEREKEATRINGPIPVVGSAPGGTRSAGWYLKPWIWFGFVGVIIVILGGTAWHFYRQSRENSLRLAERASAVAPSPMQHPAESTHKAVPAPISEPARPEPRRPLRPSPSDRTMQPKSVHEKSASQQRTTPNGSMGNPASAIQSPSTPEMLPTPETAPTAEGTATKKDSAKVEAPPTVPLERPNTASKRNATGDAYKTTPLLTDGRLRIHAIAWSSNPEDRMAVINSRVIHEGDSVDDFAVVVIRPDDVVVREKGKGVWRVQFGRP